MECGKAGFIETKGFIVILRKGERITALTIWIKETPGYMKVKAALLLFSTEQNE